VKWCGEEITGKLTALLNAKGGSAYWGIRDNDRRVVGMPLNG
jgi:hypothetical protein